MASKKKKPARFTTGPEYTYWPVFEGGRVVALCPNMSEAQRITEMLNEWAGPNKGEEPR